MDIAPIQIKLFTVIRSGLPGYLSLAEEIAEALNISTDSAYRRIRGTKAITLAELATLVQRYQFSVDALLSAKSESYMFSGKFASAEAFEEWMARGCNQFEQMAKHGHAHLYYQAKDLPFAHFFQIPELASFKCFFWQKTLLLYNELRNAKYKLGKMSDRCSEIAAATLKAYNNITTSELWSAETIDSVLRQIQYYHEAGIFEHKTDPKYLCDAYDQLIEHLERQAEEGVKFPFGQSPSKSQGKYYIYNNELMLGNNHLLVDFGNHKISYLNHSGINYVSTLDKAFNDHHQHAVNNMISKSEPLHTSNEKRRRAFFNILREKIEATRRATS